MNDFSIKEFCERCNSKKDIDGVLFPYFAEDGELVVEQATLCKSCRDEFQKLVDNK